MSHCKEATDRGSLSTGLDRKNCDYTGLYIIPVSVYNCNYFYHRVTGSLSAINKQKKTSGVEKGFGRNRRNESRNH